MRSFSRALWPAAKRVHSVAVNPPNKPLDALHAPSEKPILLGSSKNRPPPINPRKAKQIHARQEGKAHALHLQELDALRKKEDARLIVENVDPLSDEQLLQIYNELMSASPDDLNYAFHAAPKDEILDLPSLAVSREDALSALHASVSAYIDANPAVDAAHAVYQVVLSTGAVVDVSTSAVTGADESGQSVADDTGQSVADNNPSASAQTSGDFSSDNEHPTELHSPTKSHPSTDAHPSTDIRPHPPTKPLPHIMTGLFHDDKDLFFAFLKSLNREQQTTCLDTLADSLDSQHRLALSSQLRNAGLAPSPRMHHYQIDYLVRQDRLDDALAHLFAAESLTRPLQASYRILLEALLDPRLPGPFYQRGWDLFAHMRLVSHPNPTRQIYETMIAACASGGSPSAIRAADLFHEMVSTAGHAPSERAYSGLIRAHARSKPPRDTRRRFADRHDKTGSQSSPSDVSNYKQALVYLQQMLDINLKPSLLSVEALIEGASLAGDLARARWLFLQLVESAYPTRLSYPSQHDTLSRETPIRSNTLAFLISAYATCPLTHTNKHFMVSTSESTPTDTAPYLRHYLSLLQPEKVALLFPGPLPSGRAELITEVLLLIKRFLGPNYARQLYSALEKHIPLNRDLICSDDALSLASVPITPFLLNSILRFCVLRLPYHVVVPIFDSLESIFGIPPDDYSYKLVFQTLAHARNSAHADILDAHASRLFSQWLETKSTDTANIAYVWATVINRAALSSKGLQRANDLFDEFVLRYHNVDITPADNVNLPELPSRISLSSPLYPETMGRSAAPPRLEVHMLRPYINVLALLGLRDRQRYVLNTCRQKIQDN